MRCVLKALGESELMSMVYSEVRRYNKTDWRVDKATERWRGMWKGGFSK